MLERFLEYLELEKRKSRHTVCAYQNDLNQFFSFCIPHFGKELQDFSQVTRLDLRAFLVHLKQKKLSEKSINRKLCALRSFFRYLKKEGIVQKNPVLELKSLRTPKRLPSFVNQSDMLLLLQHLSEQPLHNDRMVLELLYGLGLRRQELCQLKVQDLDFDRKQVAVLGKRHKKRWVPMHENLFALLKDYLYLTKKTGSEFLLSTPKGGKVYPSYIYRLVRKNLLGVRGLSQKSPHVMRHSFATHLLDNGANLKAIKDLLGHSSLASTQVYTHNSLEKLKQVYKNAHPKS